MPIPTPPRFRGFYTTLRIEMTRTQNSAPVQAENTFTKYVDAFKSEMENSIRINEEAMDRITLFEHSGALQYRRFFFIIEGEKEACNKVLDLFASLPPETEVKEAIRRGKKLVQDLIQDSENAYSNSQKSDVQADNLVNIKNVKIGYALTEDCLRRAGRFTS